MGNGRTGQACGPAEKAAARRCCPLKKYVSQAAAARRLPVSATTLRERARAPDGQLFRPAAIIGRDLRYHVRQLELIEGVLLGNVDQETATLEWQVFWRGIGRKRRR